MALREWSPLRSPTRLPTRSQPKRPNQKSLPVRRGDSPLSGSSGGQNPYHGSVKPSSLFCSTSPPITPGPGRSSHVKKVFPSRCQRRCRLLGRLWSSLMIRIQNFGVRLPRASKHIRQCGNGHNKTSSRSRRSSDPFRTGSNTAQIARHSPLTAHPQTIAHLNVHCHGTSKTGIHRVRLGSRSVNHGVLMRPFFKSRPPRSG